jgi:hypothetical protein
MRSYVIRERQPAQSLLKRVGCSFYSESGWVGNEWAAGTDCLLLISVQKFARPVVHIENRRPGSNTVLSHKFQQSGIMETNLTTYHPLFTQTGEQNRMRFTFKFLYFRTEYYRVQFEETCLTSSPLPLPQT